MFSSRVSMYDSESFALVRNGRDLVVCDTETRVIKWRNQLSVQLLLISL